jgi:hypothetical protein
VPDFGIVRCGLQTCESPNVSRYCTGKASFSDRSSTLSFRTAVGKFIEIPVGSFHCGTDCIHCVQVLVRVSVHEESDETLLNQATLTRAFPGVGSKAVRVNVLSLFNCRSCVGQQLRGSLSVWMDFIHTPDFP